MIAWLLTSAILSGIGALVYRFLIQPYGPARLNKTAVYIAISASLLLPAWFQPAHSHRHADALALHESIDPLQLQQFCQCEQPDYGHRVHFRVSASYNQLLLHKNWIAGFVLAGAGFVVLRAMGQMLYLLVLARRSAQRRVTIAGREVTALYGTRYGAGAFWLGRPFLIWQEEMNALSPIEQEAVAAHELSHLRQYNTIEKAALQTLQCFWLLNPAFYYFRRELHLLSEQLADEAGSRVMGSKKIYAHLLLRLKAGQMLHSVSHFNTRPLLRTRIERLMQAQKRRKGLMLLLLLMPCLQFAFTQPTLGAAQAALQRVECYEDACLNQPDAQELYYCTDCHSVCQPGS